MADAAIDAAVRAVVGAVLHREVGAGEPVSRDTESAWDSLRHMEILFAVEDRLDVRFDEAELGALRSVDDIVRAVERHRAA
ncbi:MAG TPA: acyl carrier protein [Gemmatimonadaceae bacterium]